MIGNSREKKFEFTNIYSTVYGMDKIKNKLLIAGNHGLTQIDF